MPPSSIAPPHAFRHVVQDISHGIFVQFAESLRASQGLQHLFALFILPEVRQIWVMEIEIAEPVVELGEENVPAHGTEQVVVDVITCLGHLAQVFHIILQCSAHTSHVSLEQAVDTHVWIHLVQVAQSGAHHVRQNVFIENL